MRKIENAIAKVRELEHRFRDTLDVLDKDHPEHEILFTEWHTLKTFLSGVGVADAREQQREEWIKSAQPLPSPSPTLPYEDDEGSVYPRPKPRYPHEDPDQAGTW